MNRRGGKEHLIKKDLAKTLPSLANSPFPQLPGGTAVDLWLNAS